MELTIKTTIEGNTDQEVIHITGKVSGGSLRHIKQELERQQEQVVKKMLDSKLE